MMPSLSRPVLLGLGPLLAGWLWLSPTMAELASDSVYDAEVPIQDQSPEQRNRAIEDAFRMVLGRLYGGEAVTSDPRLVEATKGATRLVRSYRFRWDEAGPSGRHQLLAVQFDQAAVNRTLREKGLAPPASTTPPLATAEAPAQPPRPAAGAPSRGAAEQGTLVLWLASERAGQRAFALPETEPNLVAVARAAARDAGVSVLFPLYDLEDRSQLSAADLWAMRAAPIQVASRRYAAEHVMVGLVSGSEIAGWTGRWALIGSAGVASEWTSRGASPSAVVQAGIQQARGRDTGGGGVSKPAPSTLSPAKTAQPPAAVPGPATTPVPAGLPPSGVERAAPAGDLLAVRVSGVQRSDDYRRVQKYLAGLPGVGQVQVLGVAGDAVTFGLGGGAEALSRSIASGKVLAPEEGVPAGAAPGRQLRYRLLP